MNFKSCSFKALQRVLGLARLCNPTDYSPSGASVRSTSQARVLERVHFPLQGVFPTQGLNPGLPLGSWILYH